MSCRPPLLALLLLLGVFRAPGQSNELRALNESLGHIDARLSRQVNELLWFHLLSEVAVVDKVRFAGPPPRSTNLLDSAESNHVVISAFACLPRRVSRFRKIPLVVFAHGEIHGNTASDEDPHVVRELVRQGYAVIAPDYRGSSGYGEDYWKQIDYGGLEVEDVEAARRYMLERHPEIDARRVGIMGWSHGGAIALLACFAHPESYAACYAGVPVSDLEMRLQFRGPGYEQLFSAPYHVGRSLAEAPEEYRRRSAAWNAAKLRTPLLLHANTNDEDVTWAEVQRLIRALQAAQKSFECHVYTNAPGGHQFNRLDTPLALDSRDEVWRFLAKYLHPPHPAAKR